MPVRTKPQNSQVTKRPPAPEPTKPIKPAALEVLDIPVDLLVPDEDNPNVMNEATFDLLVEEIKEQGFDEPIQVRPHPTQEGYYQIGSGHHRVKAAMVLRMATVPAVIKHWSDREQKLALTKRNVLRGSLDRMKFKKLYEDLAKGRDPSVVQRELGFTDPKQVNVLIDQAKKNMTPAQRKKLDEAKENIKTLDDLSSVLNKIFKESGSEIEEGYVVFSFGGKKHHYIKIDAATNTKLEALKAEAEAKGIDMRDFLQSIVASATLQGYAPTKPAAKKKLIRKPKG
jgi:ParB/RepB/Spo0J family partition protein